jgi:hypothetical protein
MTAEAKPVVLDPAQVGIFWRVQTSGAAPTLLVDCVPVQKGEPYGDFLCYGGHYEFWTDMAGMTPSQLRQRHLPDVARWSEYEEWPRGRVVLHVPTSRFILYADRKLQGSTTIARIVERFSLPQGGFDVRGDAHYVSVR